MYVIISFTLALFSSYAMGLMDWLPNWKQIFGLFEVTLLKGQTVFALFHTASIVWIALETFRNSPTRRADIQLRHFSDDLDAARCWSLDLQQREKRVSQPVSDLAARKPPHRQYHCA